jgi:hypothetical protein
MRLRFIEVDGVIRILYKREHLQSDIISSEWIHIIPYLPLKSACPFQCVACGNALGIFN